MLYTSIVYTPIITVIKYSYTLPTQDTSGEKLNKTFHLIYNGIKLHFMARFD